MDLDVPTDMEEDAYDLLDSAARTGDGTEPEQVLYEHLCGFHGWQLSQLPRLVGGLYAAPGHGAMWKVSLSLKEQCRRLYYLQHRQMMASGTRPAAILATTAARLIAALVRPPDDLFVPTQFCSLPMSSLVTPQFWEAQLITALQDWDDRRFPPKRQPNTLAACNVNRVRKPTYWNNGYTFAGFNLVLPPMLVGNILGKIPSGEPNTPIFYEYSWSRRASPIIKAYVDDMTPLLPESHWQWGRTRLPSAFNTATGIVWVRLQAPLAPWEAGTVSPAQQLVTQLPSGFSSQPFVDNHHRLTLWDPAKAARSSYRVPVGSHRLQLDHSCSEVWAAASLVWPGQAIATADDMDSQTDTTDA